MPDGHTNFTNLRIDIAPHTHYRWSSAKTRRVSPKIFRAPRENCFFWRTCRFLKSMKTGYLIDMDGVIYRENRLIPGAAEFVRALQSSGTPYLFLTNNSAPTPE